MVPLNFLSTEVLGASLSPTTLEAIVLLLLVFGFAKGGLMPFHSFWCDGGAYTGLEALLHAVAVVKVGVFYIIRSIHWCL